MITVSSSKPLTPAQIKRKLWAEGSTVRAWSEANGYSYSTVASVMCGRIKLNRCYGKSFEIATKLGLVVESANGDLIRAQVAA